MNKFFAVFLTLLASAAYAQKSEVDVPDADWGENQNFEARTEYWHKIETSGPDTNIVEAKLRGYNQFISIPRSKAMMVQSSTAWEQVGGSQGHTVSGRPTCIDFDPKNNQTMYLGTSGGGLWKTTDGGNNWSSLSDSWSSYAMGGVAVDYTDGKTIYACTGDLYDRTGDGLYKSTDAGLNWVHLADDKITSQFCNQVLIDPQVNTTIYLTGKDGVRRSLDAGQTWKKILSVGGITHMVIDPTNGQILYAAGGGVIKKSIDGGDSWSADLAKSITGKSTITLGISKNDVSKIYASIGSSSSGGALGFAQSVDAGQTWTVVNQTNYMGNQAFYDNACAANPNNANMVVVGGLDIYGSTNGGASLSQKTDWRNSTSSPNFSHADIHVLIYSPYGQLFALTDGGVFSSGNNGGSWTQSKNSGLATLLFEGGDAASDFSFIIGGAQDNGINRATNGAKFFTQTLGGDGGHCFISQSDGQTVYSTYINASLQKSGDGGMSWNYGPNPNAPNNIIPLGSKLLSDGVGFYMNYDVSESDGSVVAIAGGNNIFYSNDGVNTLFQITKNGNISGGPSAVHVSEAASGVVYAGGFGGNVYVTQNADELTGVTWTKSTTNIGAVADFVTDPNDPGKAWACVSGFGTNHFWLTTDYGATWKAPATNLPDLNASTIARAPNGDLFLGHTFGVMRSLDNGVTWEPLRDAIPLCQITKLRVRGTNSQYLLATTYGRGMYRININDLPRVISSGVTVASSGNANMPSITRISPNPVQVNGRLEVSYSIAKEGEVSLLLYDELGREMKTLFKEYRSEGKQTAQADISSLPSGVYYAVLTSDGHSVTQKMVIAGNMNVIR